MRDLIDRRQERGGVEAGQIEGDPGEGTRAEVGERGGERVAFDPGAVAQLDSDGSERGEFLGDGVEFVEAMAVGTEAGREREEEGAEFFRCDDRCDRGEETIGDGGDGGARKRQPSRRA